MHKANSIQQLSGKTYVLDCCELIRKFLIQQGHDNSTINRTQVWVKRGPNGKVCQVGSTQESLQN